MLRVSENGRFLVHDDGRPFFYLADTAWELFHRLNDEEAEQYLVNRAQKKFTVIQAVVLAELKGLFVPDAHGNLPFCDGDINRPNERYFSWVDRVIRRANALGMYVGLLPSWGDKVGIGGGGDGPENFINENNAYAYGLFLGKRYSRSDVIWILGGDRNPDYTAAIWRLLAQGIRDGDGGRGLMSYHPAGGYHSSWFFHDEPWLDFNMCQTGHTMMRDNYRDIMADYALRPVKPCLDAEPGYEDVPHGRDPTKGYLDAYHVRVSAYWAVFSGACGHAYGCHGIWQFYSPKSEPINHAPRFWYDALDLPGSFQMQHLRTLMESRPFLSRIPDQTLVYPNMPWGDDHVRATRDGTPGKADARYILAYFPAYKELSVFTHVIAGTTLNIMWYNPQTGTTEKRETVPNTGSVKACPPVNAPKNDWVLIIDDAEAGFPVAPTGREGAAAQ